MIVICHIKLLLSVPLLQLYHQEILRCWIWEVRKYYWVHVLLKQLLCWEKLAQCYVNTRSRCEHEKKLKKIEKKKKEIDCATVKIQTIGVLSFWSQSKGNDSPQSFRLPKTVQSERNQCSRKMHPGITATTLKRSARCIQRKLEFDVSCVASTLQTSDYSSSVCQKPAGTAEGL